jgi:hypothetical protein
MHFWAPDIDPAHPMDCTQPERYVLQRLSNRHFIAINRQDQNLIDVEEPLRAYLFHTHEAALRAAGELTRLGNGDVDVVKIELDVG